MNTGTIRIFSDVGGVNQTIVCSRTGSGQGGQSVTLPAAKSGTLSTRTDNDTGVVAATAHGLSVSDIVNIFWAGGMRYGMKVSSSADADHVTVGTDAGDVGAGDNFPIATTPVTISKAVNIDLDVDGDLFAAIVASATQRAHVNFMDVDDASLKQVEIPTALEGFAWYDDSAFALPITGNPVAYVLASNGTTTEAVLTIGYLYASA